MNAENRFQTLRKYLLWYKMKIARRYRKKNGPSRNSDTLYYVILDKDKIKKSRNPGFFPQKPKDKTRSHYADCNINGTCREQETINRTSWFLKFSHCFLLHITNWICHSKWALLHFKVSVYDFVLLTSFFSLNKICWNLNIFHFGICFIKYVSYNKICFISETTQTTQSIHFWFAILLY